MMKVMMMMMMMLIMRMMKFVMMLVMMIIMMMIPDRLSAGTTLSLVEGCNNHLKIIYT